MSKGSGPLGFRGSSQGKSPSEIFRFGYEKAVNDKMVPDPVGSGIFVLHRLPFVRPFVRVFVRDPLGERKSGRAWRARFRKSRAGMPALRRLAATVPRSERKPRYGTTVRVRSLPSPPA